MSIHTSVWLYGIIVLHISFKSSSIGAFLVNQTSFSWSGTRCVWMLLFCWFLFVMTFTAVTLWPLTELNELANPLLFLNCLKQSNPAFWHVKLQTVFRICICFFEFFFFSRIRPPNLAYPTPSTLTQHLSVILETQVETASLHPNPHCWVF